jgi:hypothetical protein
LWHFTKVLVRLLSAFLLGKEKNHVAAANLPDRPHSRHSGNFLVESLSDEKSSAGIGEGRPPVSALKRRGWSAAGH